MQCRYAGHLTKFYSVAEHSVWVSKMCPPRHALWGLMHDAAEAYITDIPTPVKNCVPGIRDLEDFLLGRIAIRFNLPTLKAPVEVKEADVRMLMTEKEQFYPGVDIRDWEVLSKPYSGVFLDCFIPTVAERLFIARFNELTKCSLT